MFEDPSPPPPAGEGKPKKGRKEEKRLLGILAQR